MNKTRCYLDVEYMKTEIEKYLKININTCTINTGSERHTGNNNGGRTCLGVPSSNPGLQIMQVNAIYHPDRPQDVPDILESP